jgi:biopolymer transport protein TolR
MKIQSANHQRISGNLSEINIIPLVDIMLVLLIIFMVTAPMMNSGMQVNLPTAETRTDPSSGGLVLTITRDHYIYMEDKAINLFLLESRLKTYFYDKSKKVVFLKADKDISYGYVISVMDVIKKAGIETIAMIVDHEKKK